MKKFAFFLGILFLCTAIYANSEIDRVRHSFLILSSDEPEHTAQRAAALKKLTRSKKDAVAISLEYMNRKSPAVLETVELVVLALGEDAVKPLTQILTQPNENTAALAAHLLGKIGSRSSAVPLILASKSSGGRLRSAALGALGNCADTLALPTLIEALSDNNPQIRRQAAISLGKIRSKKAVKNLIPLLGDNNGFVRYSASYALASIGDIGVLETLSERLSDTSTSEIERFHIIETIGHLKSPDSIPLLFELLEDPSHFNRGFACQALGYYRGNFEVANALKRCKNDGSGFVRMMAEQALVNIRGE